MREPRIHLADLLYGRPACGSESKLVTEAESQVTCRTCRRVLEECAVSADERVAAHG
jgi:hypothetical protein